MDYKKVLRLHYVNHLSSREIAASNACGKTTINEFLKRFRECSELSYPLPNDVTNEYVESILYKKPGVSAEQLLLSLHTALFDKHRLSCVPRKKQLNPNGQP